MKMIKNTTIRTQFCKSSALQAIKSGVLVTILSFSLFTTQAGNNSVNNNTDNVAPISDIFISSVGHNLVLSWQIDKTLFNYFEVERSLDGKSFSTIGLVLDAPENSNTCLFKDKKSDAPSSAWYRIKGIVKDGTIRYSSSSRYFETLPEEQKITVNNSFSPNPFTSNGTLKYFSRQAGFAAIMLQSAAGETLLSKQSVLIKGSNTISIGGLDKLASGIYIARLIINGMEMVNQKVVKE